MTLFSELKRRNVLRVAAAEAAVLIATGSKTMAAPIKQMYLGSSATTTVPLGSPSGK